jgi:hypothetical protein
MEADIRLRIAIPSRPSTAAELQPKAVSQAYDLEDTAVTTVMAEMKQKTTAPTTGHWPLDRPTYNDWRLLTKNKTRDWQKYAAAALIEEMLVAEYRPTLLKESLAASQLRTLVETLLSGHATRRNVIDPSTGTMKKVKQWTFPDRLPNVEHSDTAFPDIGEVFEELSGDISTSRWKAGIEVAMKSILRLPTAALTPRVKLVHPVIKDLVSKLEQVSFRYNSDLSMYSQDTGTPRELSAPLENAQGSGGYGDQSQ